jgi:hypothetical protein
MPRATQFCIGLANQPGALAKLCGVLNRAKVNIDAISVADSADCCWVRMVASPPARAKAALRKGRFNACAQPVLAVTVSNRPGELERVAARLAKAGVNVNYVYGSNGPGTSSMLVLSVNDLARAVQVVRG